MLLPSHPPSSSSSHVVHQPDVDDLAAVTDAPSGFGPLADSEDEDFLHSLGLYTSPTLTITTEIPPTFPARLKSPSLTIVTRTYSNLIQMLHGRLHHLSGITNSLPTIRSLGITQTVLLIIIQRRLKHHRQSQPNRQHHHHHRQITKTVFQ